MGTEWMVLEVEDMEIETTMVWLIGIINANSSEKWKITEIQRSRGKA